MSVAAGGEVGKEEDLARVARLEVPPDLEPDGRVRAVELPGLMGGRGSSAASRSPRDEQPSRGD